MPEEGEKRTIFSRIKAKGKAYTDWRARGEWEDQDDQEVEVKPFYRDPYSGFFRRWCIFVEVWLCVCKWVYIHVYIYDVYVLVPFLHVLTCMTTRLRLKPCAD